MDNSADLKIMSAKLGLALQQRSYLLAIAESCTGGLVAAALTDNVGSSAWFDRGFVTYSNTSKVEMLDVAADTLKEYGAVSEQTAKEMAIGALQHSQADIAASITGIAGPSGGSANKPVGTICFAWATKANLFESSTEIFAGNRQEIRHQAAIKLMAGLINTLQKG